MFNPKPLENLSDYQCFLNHCMPICAVNLQPGLTSDQRFACKNCIELTHLNVSPLNKIIETIEKPIKQKLNQYEEIITPHLNLLKQFYGNISLMESIILQQLDQLTNLVNNWINSIKQKGEQIARYNFFNQLDLLINNQQVANEIEEKTSDFELMTINKAQSIKLNSYLDPFKSFQGYSNLQNILKQIIGSQNEVNLKECHEFQQQKQQQSISQQIKQPLMSEFLQQYNQQIQSYPLLKESNLGSSFSYQIIPKLTYEQGELCQALAINYNNTLIAIASECNINILTINQSLNQLEEPKLLQSLERNHKNHVTTLNFFKKASQMLNSLISGSLDSTIVIWTPDQQFKKWNALFKLKNHTYAINCLLISQSSEDCIVSGSADKTIKFWSMTNFNYWSCSQTIQEHTSYVYGLSINDQGNKLLSCGNDNLILIISRSHQEQWQVKQKIHNGGISISFITDNIFACSSLEGTSLIFYYMDQENGIYIQSNQFQIQTGGKGNANYFPLQYNKSKNILLSKNGHYVNLIKSPTNPPIDDNKVILEQAIFFIQNMIFGTMSDDGALLVTWDSKSSEVQFRKYKQKL
ncbi:unnamed protein product (macronuclear) [Paramecium tetraurelia]|uniref:Uncharacterized protein n=1 Tax=Paramecium tetraurelia TaxID=5888 RepID=A0EAS1_PARTE|nr:uncharacterized protein GSPATT00025122001 [Paramecium tetraurelia]CAK92388.1 unnamed protein product [Paramecium tetraurelia]|eukprot:XP_001459785.1 hypothetical protein (macronuclear) [Paramecium tetraurelia strain d4-2]